MIVSIMWWRRLRGLYDSQPSLDRTHIVRAQPRPAMFFGENQTADVVGHIFLISQLLYKQRIHDDCDDATPYTPSASSSDFGNWNALATVLSTMKPVIQEGYVKPLNNPVVAVTGTV